MGGGGRCVGEAVVPVCSAARLAPVAGIRLPPRWAEWAGGWERATARRDLSAWHGHGHHTPANQRAACVHGSSSQGMLTKMVGPPTDILTSWCLCCRLHLLNPNANVFIASEENMKLSLIQLASISMFLLFLFSAHVCRQRKEQTKEGEREKSDPEIEKLVFRQNLTEMIS